jgi:glycosyltransferase involved in cell wall biosynthesis
MAERIPIVVVANSLDRGGTEQHLLQVLPRLNKTKFEVSVLPLRPGGALAGAFRQQGLVIGPSKLSRLRALTFLASWVAKQRPIVHCFLPEPYVLAAPVAILMRTSAVMMSRRGRNLYQLRHRTAARVERRLHRYMTALVGNSATVVRDLLDEGAPPERVRLIYNGIDTTVFPAGEARVAIRNRVRRQLGLPDDRVVLICVANLFSYKGHADLFAALATLGATFRSRCTLLVVGRDAGSLHSLKNLSVQLGLSDNIRFLGQSDEVPALLAAADIGVLASHEEGFSNAVLEGMAAGLPMIVSDVGGNGEAVIDGQCGLVVPARDSERLAEAVRVLIEDPQLRHTMGDCGRERAISTYSIAACVAAYEGLYEEVWRRYRQEVRQTCPVK